MTSKFAVSALSSVLILGCAGFTECKWFSTTRVPASDNARPNAWTSVYDNGNHEAFAVNEARLEYRLDREDNAATALAAAVDPGGARQVDSSWRVVAACCSTVFCRDAVRGGTDTGSERRSQAGTTGARVSNGVYAGRTFRPDDYRHLCAPRPLAGVAMHYRSTARDFHGNTRTSAESVLWWMRDPGPEQGDSFPEGTLR